MTRTLTGEVGRCCARIASMPSRDYDAINAIASQLPDYVPKRQNARRAVVNQTAPSPTQEEEEFVEEEEEPAFAGIPASHQQSSPTGRQGSDLFAAKSARQATPQRERLGGSFQSTPIEVSALQTLPRCRATFLSVAVHDVVLCRIEWLRHHRVKVHSIVRLTTWSGL